MNRERWRYEEQDTLELGSRVAQHLASENYPWPNERSLRRNWYFYFMNDQ